MPHAGGAHRAPRRDAGISGYTAVIALYRIYVERTRKIQEPELCDNAHARDRREIETHGVVLECPRFGFAACIWGLVVAGGMVGVAATCERPVVPSVAVGGSAAPAESGESRREDSSFDVSSSPPLASRLLARRAPLLVASAWQRAVQPARSSSNGSKALSASRARQTQQHKSQNDKSEYPTGFSYTVRPDRDSVSQPVRTLQNLVLVLCRVVLRRDDEAAPLPCATVHRLNDIDHLLFVWNGPVDLVVVTCSQIDHDVLSTRRVETV
jgi:hypothetical protein